LDRHAAGGLLHDIGKIGVSDSILHKPDKLTEDEWADMRRHPKIGYDMIRDIGFLSGAAKIVLEHHERFDGKGYPAASPPTRFCSAPGSSCWPTPSTR